MLCYIAFLNNRKALVREWTKVANNLNLPIHMDSRTTEGRLGLELREPPWVTVYELLLEDDEIVTKWYQNCVSESLGGHRYRSKTIKQPSFDLATKIWVLLTR